MSHQPVAPLGGSGSVEAVAWRCEQCRRLQPLSITSTVIYVEDFGSLRLSGATRSRPRYLVRMVVCPPCHRSIATIEGEKP